MNIQSTSHAVRKIGANLYSFVAFFLLLLIFVIQRAWIFCAGIPALGWVFKRIQDLIGSQVGRASDAVVARIEATRTTEVKRGYLIRLAFKNLLHKKTRSFITILGMSVGIGSIVLLLSIGFGIERLIISRVAGLNELKMLDVATGVNTTARINGATLDKIKKIGNVVRVSPIISVVGKVSMNKATTDVLVYAAPKDYIDQNKTKLLQGNLYSDNSLYEFTKAGEVAGATTELPPAHIGSSIGTASQSFTIPPDQTAYAYVDCDMQSTIVGLVRHVEGGYIGVPYWGASYAPYHDFGRAGWDGMRQTYAGKWIKASMPIYTRDAADHIVPKEATGGHQEWQDVCVAQSDVIILPNLTLASVLAASTGSATATEEALSDAPTYEVVSATGSGDLEMVSLVASASAIAKTDAPLAFTGKTSGQAVISKGLMDLLGIPPVKAVGTPISISFIVTNAQIPTLKGKSLSQSATYTIVGVLDDAETSYLYVPIADVQKLGVTNFSQLKVLFKNSDSLTSARKTIDSLGLRTTSTLDTVKNIESLFTNVRLFLGLLGMVALGVASLGMFNTLTVSLLERTREIGGMKTIGMVSEEVGDLFLAEAMIMGLAGGVGGLALGWLGGKILSLVLSSIAIFKGQGFMDVTFIPVYFVVFIIFSSFVVGILTGLYPSYRAKHISALNALRYE